MHLIYLFLISIVLILLILFLTFRYFCYLFGFSVMFQQTLGNVLDNFFMGQPFTNA